MQWLWRNHIFCKSIKFLEVFKSQFITKSKGKTTIGKNRILEIGKKAIFGTKNTVCNIAVSFSPLATLKNKAAPLYYQFITELSQFILAKPIIAKNFKNSNSTIQISNFLAIISIKFYVVPIVVSPSTISQWWYSLPLIIFTPERNPQLNKSKFRFNLFTLSLRVSFLYIRVSICLCYTNVLKQ